MPEGRGGTLENVMQSRHEPDSVPEKAASLTGGSSPQEDGCALVSNGLHRVREIAKRDKDVKFTSLMHHINLKLLFDSFHLLNKKSAPGLDDVVWADYNEHLVKNLQDLHARIQSGSYKAFPGRRVYIPKSDGSRRPLGIIVLEDKIVQRAVAEVLSSIYEQDFVGFSYGFRPGRGCHDALDALYMAIWTKRVNFILDADIKSFFDSIAHDKLMSFLEIRIADPRILRLIRLWLKAGVLEEGAWSSTDEGVQQGGVISPLLANVFLHYALDKWTVKWRGTYAMGDMVIVRYADDFVVGFESRGEAGRYRLGLSERLKGLGLELHPGKTRLLEFGRYALSNRKREKRGRPETFDFLGFTHICSTTRSGAFKILRRTAAKRMTSKLKSLKEALRARINMDVRDVAKWLGRVVQGYYNYFAIHDNLDVLSTFRYLLGKIWYKVICRRGQKRKITWEKFIGKWWGKIPMPKVRHQYPSERFYVKHPERSPVR